MRNKKFKKNQKAELVRLAEYAVAGGAYFWSGYAAFFICDHLLHMNLWWAKLIANVIGVSVNFILERYWVFNGKKLRRDITQVTWRYLFITGINFIIDYYIVFGLKQVGISPYLGQFGSAGFFFVWNYLWYRLWVFAKPPVKSKSKVNKIKRKVRYS